MMNALGLVKVECRGGCGTYVSPGAGFCVQCAALDRMLEDRRMRQAALRERVVARVMPPVSRADMGVVPCPEAASLPEILASLTSRERRRLIALCVASACLAPFLIAVLWFGFRDLLRVLLWFSAT